MDSATRQPRRAVLVEDNPGVQRELTERLLALGFDEVVGCADVAPALLLLRQERWDLAIVDLALRTSYGLFVLDALSDRAPHQKLVVFTVAATEEARLTCATLGCDAVFQRPAETEALLAFCRTVLAGR